MKRAPRLVIAALLAAPGLVPSRAHAEASGLSQLHAAFASDDAAAKRDAAAAWRVLDDVSLEDVDALIASLAISRPPESEVVAALVRLRDASPSAETPDTLDLAAGIDAAIVTRQNVADRLVAEHILLLRLLEGIGTIDAAKRMATLITMDGSAWMPEARRIRLRMGMRLAPWFVSSQNDTRPVVRTWARAGIEQLRLTDAPSAISRAQDSATLAALLIAYATIRDMSAMRTIGAYMNAEKAFVRAAARDAILRYGRNSIWVLRDTFTRTTQREADLTLGPRELAIELFRALDEERIRSAELALSEADGAIGRGAAQEAFTALERISLTQPGAIDEGELSRRYESVAVAAEAAELAPLASSAWNRVRWTTEEPERIHRARTRALALRARDSAAGGVADSEALAATLSDGAPARLRVVHDVVTGEAAERTRSRRKLAFGGLAFAAAMLAYAAWPRKRHERPRLVTSADQAT